MTRTRRYSSPVPMSPSRAVPDRSLTRCPAEIGATRLSAATVEVPVDVEPKVAARFVWEPGDITITNPDGTVVTS